MSGKLFIGTKLFRFGELFFGCGCLKFWGFCFHCRIIEIGSVFVGVRLWSSGKLGFSPEFRAGRGDVFGFSGFSAGIEYFRCGFRAFG
jgi:hypothetical protein